MTTIQAVCLIGFGIVIMDCIRSRKAKDWTILGFGIVMAGVIVYNGHL